MNDKPGEQNLLRDAAEVKLAQHVSRLAAMARPVEELLHELQVHQIELEMQNETLRQTQIAMEESRDRYVDLYDFSPVAYFTLTAAGLISEVNLTGAAQLKVERKKLLQRRFTQFVALEHRDRWYRFFSRAKRLGEAQHIELILTCADGAACDVRMDCLPIQADSGGLSVRIALTDVTERNRAEEALRLSALRYQLLFDSSRDALMTAAPPTWRFTAANTATLQLFGASSIDEITALAPRDVSPVRQPDGRLSNEKALEMIAIALHAGSHLFEWEHQRLDGQTFPADVLLTRMESGGEVFVQATVRDISERKKLGDEIRGSRQQLRELAKKIELLREEERKYIAREVHDELGQILTALRMDVALVNLRFGGKNTEFLAKTQGMTALLDQASRAVRNIVSNLRPTALDMGLVHAVGWLCNEFSAHIGSRCVFHTIETHVQLEEDRSVAIFRVVQELLTNAARHAEANNVTVDLVRNADYLSVKVSDDGKGFDSLATANNKSFGLLGVRERALSLGGHLEVVSAPGQGTRVILVVPIKPNGDER